MQTQFQQEQSLKRMEGVHPYVPAYTSLTDLAPNAGLMAPEAAPTVKGAKVDTAQTHRVRPIRDLETV